MPYDDSEVLVVYDDCEVCSTTFKMLQKPSTLTGAGGGGGGGNECSCAVQRVLACR